MTCEHEPNCRRFHTGVQPVARWRSAPRGRADGPVQFAPSYPDDARLGIVFSLADAFGACCEVHILQRW